MAAPADVSPWVIVAGGFHQRGGMDRANAALAAYLLASGASVHLVAHEVDSTFRHHALATAHLVHRPGGMPGLAETLLSRTGIRVARQVLSSWPNARVVVNGGNCPWPDINWVHYVHAAWPLSDVGTAWWSRFRNRRLSRLAQRRERIALQRARGVIANSDATKRDVVTRVGVSPDRVRTVYLGADPAWGPVEPQERAAARATFRLPDDAPVVAFVGALGTDLRKGFDILWEAWKLLTATGQWDAHLLVAGGGWRLRSWRDEGARDGSHGSAHFLGFTPRIREVLAASDLLVSPVRYEAYGLNVHEALCRGLAVMVTATAGVAERFDPEMSDMLLPAHLTAGVLAERLRAWRRDVAGWRARAASTSDGLRARSWGDMAAEFVEVVRSVPA